MTRTPLSKAEAWARREMQNAESPADREFMAMVTHRVVSVFLPEDPKPTDGQKDPLSALRALAEGRK